MKDGRERLLLCVVVVGCCYVEDIIIITLYRWIF
jgi:hypothetical protein